MSHTIGQAAEMMGVATSTLRYYEREGLLPELARDAGGRRVFGDAHLGALRVISCLQRSGMQIKDIRQFMDWAQQGDETLGQRRALFAQCRDQLIEQMAELQEALDLADYKNWYYTEAAKRGSEQAVLDLSDDQIPEEVLSSRARSQEESSPA